MLTDARKRALRTLLHVVLGAAGAAVLNWLFSLDATVLTPPLATLVSLLHNYLENSGLVPPLLKGDTLVVTTPPPVAPVEVPVVVPADVQPPTQDDTV